MCNKMNGKDPKPKKMSCFHAAEIVRETGISPEEIVKHYKMTVADTEPDVKEDIRELYAGLPKVELNAWKNVNSPNGDRKKFDTQTKFVSKMIAPLLVVDEVFVVGTHEVGETILPVYQMSTKKFQITFSGDFSIWEVAVSTEANLEGFKETGVFEKAEMVFEGFPEEVKYIENIFENAKKFSIKLASDYELYTFMYNFANHIAR